MDKIIIEEFLMVSLFGANYQANPVKAAINRAYRDFCRTIRNKKGEMNEGIILDVEKDKNAKTTKDIATDEIKDAVVFHLHIDPPFDGSFSVHDGIYHLTVKGNQAALCAHQRDGMLRMYHDDIANYYYLPIEGYAVHKSIAESVDKTRKEKAVRENCFHLISCSDQFLNQKTSCEQYVRSALRFLYSR